MSVTNDISTDQRVLKVCNTLAALSVEVLLIGRMRPFSTPLPELPFKTIRLKLFFDRGFLFYAEINLRLFFKLLFVKSDIFHSNDLDTLLPNFLVSKWRNKKLVYDAHEYFTEVPEIQKRPFVKKVWTTIEEFIFPKLKYVFTVNESIAHLYFKKYGIKPSVMKNVPPASTLVFQKSRKELGMPEDKVIIILQGNGINKDRGSEEAVLAMKNINNAVFYIIGTGDALPEIQRLIKVNELQEKIKVLPRMLYSEMMEYTRNADIGLTLDKNTNINYQFSLPNKIYDYLSAGIAILASDLVEIRKVLDFTNAGILIEEVTDDQIAQAINSLINNPDLLNELKSNSRLHSNAFTWENEVTNLSVLYQQFQAENN